MEFEPLRTLITDQKIQTSIDELLEQKKNADEKTFIKPVVQLNLWLTETLAFCRENLSLLSSNRSDTLELDTLFRKYLLP